MTGLLLVAGTFWGCIMAGILALVVLYGLYMLVGWTVYSIRDRRRVGR